MPEGTALLFYFLISEVQIGDIQNSLWIWGRFIDHVNRLPAEIQSSFLKLCYGCQAEHESVLGENVEP